MKHKTIYPVLVSLPFFVFGCAKKATTNTTTATDTPAADTPAADTPAATTTTTTAAPVQAKNLGEIYTSINTQISSLQLSTYKKTTLALADASWTSDDWDKTTRFNCPDSKCNGSITAAEYVDVSLDSARGGAVGTVAKKLDVFCMVGALLGPDSFDSAGLIKVVAGAEVPTDSAALSRVKTACHKTDADLTDLASAHFTVTTTAVTGGLYDRHVVFTDSSGSSPFYIKNSDGIIAVAMYEGATDAGSLGSGIERTIFKYDLTKKIFQFEYISVVEATGTDISTTAGSLSFQRAYHNATTKEIAYLDTAGSADYAINLTLMGLSANEGETQAGAYLARAAADDTALSGSFVCFNIGTNAFINDTGCTEHAAESRKRTWNTSAAMFTALSGKLHKTDWALSATTALADFDGKTMFTLAPIYK